MVMVRVTPTEVSVRCDPFDGRPCGVRVGAEEHRVTAIERVRDESAAHPVESGPRTIFEVRTTDGRYRLAFRHRERRWLIEGVDPRPAALAAIA
jgi:hypothetical protein